MGNKLKHMKQVLTAVLTVAMIFTSVPQNVLAAELDSDSLLTDDVITEANYAKSYVVDEAADTLIEDSADVIPEEKADTQLEDDAIVTEEAKPVSNDKGTDEAPIDRDGAAATVTWNLNNCTKSNVKGATEAGSTWTIDSNAKLLSFNITAAEHYTLSSGAVKAKIGEEEETTLTADDGVYKVEKSDHSVLSENIVVNAAAERKETSITITDSTKAIGSVKYYELEAGDSWDPIAKETASFDISTGKATLIISEGNKLSINEISFLDGDLHSLVGKVSSNAIGDESGITAGEDGSYVTHPFDGETGIITITTASLKAADVKVTNLSADKIVKTDEPGSLNAGYLMHDTDYVFKLATTLSGSEVTGASYTVKGGTEKTAEDAGEGKYKVPAEDVNAAILAGGLSVSATLAAESEKVTFKFAPSSAVTEIRYQEYDNTTEDPAVGIEKVLTGSLLSSDCIIKKGNSIIITGITCGDSESDKAYVKKVSIGSEVIGTYSTVNESYEETILVRTINDGQTIAVTAASLPASNVKFNTESDNKVTIETAIMTVTIDGVEYADLSYLYSYGYESGLYWGCYVNSGSSEWNYQVASPVSYQVESGSTGKITEYISGGYRRFYPIPTSAVSEAAFGGKKITLDLKLQKLGYKKQSVKVWRSTQSSGDDKPADVSVRADGEPISWSNNDESGEMSYWVAYGKNADVTVNSTAGYTLAKVCYLSDETYNKLSGNEAQKYEAIVADKAPEGVTVVEAKNGAASFTIKNVKERYQVFVVESEAYALRVNNEAVASGKTIDVAYNVPSYKRPEISVVKGKTEQSMSTALLSANIVKDGSVIDVTSDVFGPMIPEATSVTFDPSSSKVQGQTVNVTISKAAAGSDSGYEYSLSFAVSGPITAQTIGFTGDTTVILGTEATVALKTGSDYKPGTVKVRVAPSAVAGLTCEMSEDGKSVIVKSRVKNYNTESLKNILARTDLGLELYDINDSTTISGNKLRVTASQVKDTVLSGNIVTSPGSDSITLDFSKIKLDAPEADGLYYEVKANRLVSSNELKEEVSAMVSAKEKKYEIVLANNADSFEPDSIAYNVSVKLVQVTTGVKVSEAVAADIVASTASGKEFTQKVSTVQDGTFPTSIKFNKTKDKSVAKKFFDTVEEDLAIGTIAYGKIGKVYPSVQRIKKVTIDGEEKPTAVYEKNGTIYLNPSEAGAGKHTIIAYAVEPKGKDVTTKAYTVTVKKGTYSIWVNAPSNIYKGKNKTTAKASATCYDIDYNEISGKVTWSLAKDDGTPFTYNGIKINNKGVVTIDKKVTIPDEGITFYILAKADDYPGNGASGSQEVSVHAVSEPPVHITAGSIEIVDGGSYTTNEIMGSLSAYDSNMEYLDGVEFTVKGLASAKKDGKKFYYANKIGKKVTITATKTDGSGLKKKVSFKVKSDSFNNANLYGTVGGTTIAALGSKVTATNNFASGKALTLNVTGEKYYDLVDYTISVSGGKKKAYLTAAGPMYGLISPVYGYYTITPTAPTTVITLTDKATKKVTTITLTNTAISSSKTSIKVTGSNKYASSYNTKKKTLKLTDNKGSIFNTLYYDDAAYAASGSCNKVTYTVKAEKNPATGKVRVSTDNSALISVFNNNPGFTTVSGISGEYVATLTNGQFTIDYASVKYGDGAPEDATFYIPKGNYSFTVTPINDSGAATGKAATFKFKAKAAPVGKVKLNVKTINNFTGQADVGFKTMKNVVFNGANTSAHLSATLGNNDKGKISSFATTFKAENGKLTCINTVKKDEESAITGWIKYEWTNPDGSTGTDYQKVTVKGKIAPPAVH